MYWLEEVGRVQAQETTGRQEPGERDYSKCFGCGKDNPIGLKLDVRREGGRALAEFVPGELHQGWPGIMHGGVVLALLDEMTGYAVYFEGLTTVTARIAVRFRHTVRYGEKLLLSAEITKRAKRLVEVKGSVTLADGTPVTEAVATMYILNQDEMSQRGIV